MVTRSVRVRIDPYGKATMASSRRADYLFFLAYRTRWWVVTEILTSKWVNPYFFRSDNDQYSHINNSVYYHLIDSVVNEYLIRHCGLEPSKSELIGLVVSSFCQVRDAEGRRRSDSICNRFSSLHLCHSRRCSI
jgi:hypothetical protein